jgi:hypothetical protein
VFPFEKDTKMESLYSKFPHLSGKDHAGKLNIKRRKILK